MIRLPAEWEPQQCVLFSFPRRDGDWGPELTAASRAMVVAINAVARVCPVLLVVGDPQHFAPYAADCRATVAELPTDDCWIRDAGPITAVVQGRLTLLDFVFNGWGGKYDARRDDQLPLHLAQRFPELGYARVPVVLEGGSIESDGAGTILTTTRCLLAAGRNDFANKAEAELMLRKELDANRVLWINHGELEGDDTDAHVDTLVRFLAPGVIAYVGPPAPEDDQFAEMIALKNQIEKLSDEYKVVELPWAGDIRSRSDGHRLPASYANFLISNGSLFVPTYYSESPAGHPGRALDAAALATLRSATDYRVVPVDCRAFVEQHGALHCLTMQIPATSATLPTPG